MKNLAKIRLNKIRLNKNSIIIITLLLLAVFLHLLSLTTGGFLPSALNLLTSRATDSSALGELNLTITAVTSLTSSVTTINFGSGRVNSSCRACQMDSNGTVLNIFSNGSNVSSAEGGNYCCLSFTTITSGFLLENTGNTNLSLGYTCSGNCSHTTLIGGSRGASGAFNALMLRVTTNNGAKQAGETGVVDTSDSCQGGGRLYRDEGINVTNSTSYQAGNDPAAGFSGWGAGRPFPLSSRGHWLCGNYTNSPLLPQNDRDALVVDVNMTIFDDVPGSGVASTLTLTFNGTSQ